MCRIEGMLVIGAILAILAHASNFHVADFLLRVNGNETL